MGLTSNTGLLASLPQKSTLTKQKETDLVSNIYNDLIYILLSHYLFKTEVG